MRAKILGLILFVCLMFAAVNARSAPNAPITAYHPSDLVVAMQIWTRPAEEKMETIQVATFKGYHTSKDIYAAVLTAFPKANSIFVYGLGNYCFVVSLRSPDLHTLQVCEAGNDLEPPKPSTGDARYIVPMLPVL